MDNKKRNYEFFPLPYWKYIGNIEGKIIYYNIKNKNFAEEIDGMYVVEINDNIVLEKAKCLVDKLNEDK
ncbi:MAG: hypothetical protein QW117_02490 [Candidatus Pacearchaeota archaeon]